MVGKRAIVFAQLRTENVQIRMEKDKRENGIKFENAKIQKRSVQNNREKAERQNIKKKRKSHHEIKRRTPASAAPDRS